MKLRHLSLIACLSLLCVGVADAARPGGGGGGGGPKGGGSGGGSVTNPGTKIVANPQDYVLQSDLTLKDEWNDDVTYPAGTRWYEVPNVEKLRTELAAGVYSGVEQTAKQLIVEGYDIMNNTYQKIGVVRTDGKAPLYIGRVMNCSTCHAQAGTVPYAWPFFRTLSQFGDRERQDDPVFTGEEYGFLGYYRDTTTVNRDCGINCAGQGHLPVGSEEMLALNAWVKTVTNGIYDNEGILIPELKLRVNNGKIPGARVPTFARVGSDAGFKADLTAGKRTYERVCASCHGKSGEGKWSDTSGYSVPPVAGPASYSKAGGPYMTPVIAAFIQRQMPLAKPGSLSEQDALNVAAYINALPRESRWWQDYYWDHNPCGRQAFQPLDVGVVPEGFPLTPDQVKLGPWKPIADWLKSDNCTGNSANDPYPHLLQEDFEYGYDGMGNYVKPEDVLMHRR